MFLAEILVFALHYICSVTGEGLSYVPDCGEIETHYKLTDSRRECTKHFCTLHFDWLILASQAAEAAKELRKMNQTLNFETLRGQAGVIIISHRAHKALKRFWPRFCDRDFDKNIKQKPHKFILLTMIITRPRNGINVNIS